MVSKIEGLYCIIMETAGSIGQRCKKIAGAPAALLRQNQRQGLGFFSFATFLFWPPAVFPMGEKTGFKRSCLFVAIFINMS